MNDSPEKCVTDSHVWIEKERGNHRVLMWRHFFPAALCLLGVMVVGTNDMDFQKDLTLHSFIHAFEGLLLGIGLGIYGLWFYRKTNGLSFLQVRNRVIKFAFVLVVVFALHRVF